MSTPMKQQDLEQKQHANKAITLAKMGLAGEIPFEWRLEPHWDGFTVSLPWDHPLAGDGTGGWEEDDDGNVTAVHSHYQRHQFCRHLDHATSDWFVGEVRKARKQKGGLYEWVEGRFSPAHLIAD